MNHSPNVAAAIAAGLAAAAVALFGGLIFTVAFVAIPEGAARDLLLMLAGAAVALVKDVYGYYFGSSSGSKSKEATIARAVGTEK